MKVVYGGADGQGGHVPEWVWVGEGVHVWCGGGGERVCITQT